MKRVRWALKHKIRSYRVEAAEISDEVYYRMKKKMKEEDQER